MHSWLCVAGEYLVRFLARRPLQDYPRLTLYCHSDGNDTTFTVAGNTVGTITVTVYGSNGPEEVEVPGWLGPLEYMPVWPPAIKKKGIGASKPETPPPRHTGAHVTAPITNG